MFLDNHFIIPTMLSRVLLPFALLILKSHLPSVKIVTYYITIDNAIMSCLVSLVWGPFPSLRLSCMSTLFSLWCPYTLLDQIFFLYQVLCFCF